MLRYYILGCHHPRQLLVRTSFHFDLVHLVCLFEQGACEEEVQHQSLLAAWLASHLLPACGGRLYPMGRAVVSDVLTDVCMILTVALMIPVM